MSGFLNLAGKKVLVTGLANRKSVAAHVANVLRGAGVEPVFSVHTAERREQVRNITQDAPVFVCDVAKAEDIDRLADDITSQVGELHGVVHSIAFADYGGEWKPFHETPREAFLQAVDVSCYSLIALSNALRGVIHEEASVVAISISSTTTAAENYGFMAPVKAALDSAIVFLAKSFSQFSQVRFNAVCAGPLKTASSAGIPGYLESYLHAEKMTLRKRGVSTEEVANLVGFLLSPRSSGINAQGIVIDAGMGRNAFDEELYRDT